MNQNFHIVVFLMHLNDPKKITEDDQQKLLGIEDGRTVPHLSIFSGKLFQTVLEQTKERANWPKDHCLAVLVKCMNLNTDDRDRHSHPFILIADQDEIELDEIFDFNQKKKKEGTKAGLLSYGNLGIGQLSMDHYYILFLQLKQKPPPNMDKKDANWYCVGVCDLTPEGKKMERFDEFQEKYGNDFGQGALDFVLAHNSAARSLIPMEPLKSESAIERFDTKYLKEPKKKEKKEESENENENEFLSMLSTQDIDEENSDSQRARSDDEGETLWISPSKRPIMEMEEEEEEEEEKEEEDEDEDEDEGDEEQVEEDEEERQKKRPKPLRRQIRRVVARKELENYEREDDEKSDCSFFNTKLNCIASRARATRSDSRLGMQRESTKITRTVKKRRQNNKVGSSTKTEQLNQKASKNKLRSCKTKNN